MTYLYRCTKIGPILGQQSIGNKIGRKEVCHTLRAKALEWTGRVRMVEPAKIWRDKSTVPSLYSVLCQSSASKSKSITISGHLKDNLKHKAHIIIIHSYQVSWQLSPQQRSTTHFETNRGEIFFFFFLTTKIHTHARTHTRPTSVSEVFVSKHDVNEKCYDA